jgi:hypothetical protein
VQESVLAVGEKVHIVMRRPMSDDPRRHFVGEIQAVSDHLIRVEGYLFVLHTGRNEFVKLPTKRVRIFSMIDAGNIINVLPDAVRLESLHYRFADKRVVITDDAGYSLDINEFGPIA